MMTRLALTGGLASGKSTVAEMLRQRGVPVFDADEVARALTQGEARPALVAEFGAGIVNEAGAISPRRLGDIVFAPGAEGRLAALNRILHPLIRREIETRFEALEARGAAMAAAEAALVIESGLERHYDAVILVVADEAERARRFAARTGASLERAHAVMARQWPDEKKRSRADCVIENNGDLPSLEAQVDTVVARLRG